MTPHDTTVLLADDEDTLRENLAEVLTEEEFNVIVCRDGAEALKFMRREHVDALITDLRMPGVTGMDLIDHAVKLLPNAIIIVITAFGEVDTAVEAMKKGVRDYICKPIILDDVVFRLKRLLENDRLKHENEVLKVQLRKSCENVDFIGRSPAIDAIRGTIARVATTMSNILITGESGTGKEVVARAIHASGPTRDRPFIAVNCGALPDSLIESELFGYRKGAFTGADTDRAGYFEAADGGTLFLDEIGNLPFETQAVLLRAIEQRAITRVGESRPRPVTIRLIAATNRDLAEAVDRKEFRDDLYYRINVVNVSIPPLRQRTEDIPLLVDFFLARYNRELNANCPGFAPEAIEALLHYPWRGNVRELENVIERALIFANGHPITCEELALGAGAPRTEEEVPIELRAAVRFFERGHILRTLAGVDGNKVKAARILGIGLSSLYRKLDELGIAKSNSFELVADR